MENQKINFLEKELEKLGLELTKIKQDFKKENKAIREEIREIEDKYYKLEILMAEIKQDIKYTATQVLDIKELQNSQIAEQRAFFNKAYIYLILTICIALLFLIGADPTLLFS